jgi:hypothetical protein
MEPKNSTLSPLKGIRPRRRFFDKKMLLGEASIFLLAQPRE